MTSHARSENARASQVKQKWRPSLAMIIAVVLATVMALPFVVLALFGLPDSGQLLPERRTALAALTIAGTTFAVGFVFWRTITRPMQEMVEQVSEIGRLGPSALAAPRQHGTRELAALSRSFLDMAERLFDRTEYLTTFTAHVSHELKSPLSAIQGAAELLRDTGSEMSEAERGRFLDNILADAKRLAALVSRLRELARADTLDPAGRTDLATLVPALQAAFPWLTVNAEGDLLEPVKMSAENALIVLSHLSDNASRHGAQRLEIKAARHGDVLQVAVANDGEPVSENNRDRVFAPFFTTRRDAGGTGMGLAIVAAMLRTHGGSIRLMRPPRGAAFEIALPLIRD